MIAEHSKLWDRIAAFPIDDPGSSITFTRRLARENQWSEPFTLRVVEEYRRFVFLAMVSGHPVTPSDQVDQAWHLHLTYTRSYWDDLCGGVLGKPLHHGPTRGGVKESEKFHDWYEKTLDSYRRIFGSEPPTDIWPSADDRFGRDLHFSRVNTATHWVIPRPGEAWHLLADRLRGRIPSGGLAGPVIAVAAVASVVVVGCRGAGVPAGIDPGAMPARDFLGMYLVVVVSAIIASVLLRRWLGSGEETPSDPDFEAPSELVKDPKKVDPYALILLARGPDRTAPVQAAVARLVDEGRIVFDEDRKRLLAEPPGPGRELHPVERAVLDTLRGHFLGSNWALVKEVAQSRAVEKVQEGLRESGWVRSARRGLAMRLEPALLLGAVLLVGIGRIGLGLERHRPVGFLAMLCTPLFCAIILHLGISPWRTRRGDAVVEAILRRRDQVVNDRPRPSDPRFPLAFALLGVAALPASETMEALRQEIIPPPSSGSDSGCGGDGGGGDGGGGCGGGGCGGCGG